MSKIVMGTKPPGPEAAGCWVLLCRGSKKVRPTHCLHPARRGFRTCRYHDAYESMTLSCREVRIKEPAHV